MSTNFFLNNLCIRQKQHAETRYAEYTKLNSALVAISILMNSSLSEKGMTNIPIKFTNEALKEYLEADLKSQFIKEKDRPYRNGIICHITDKLNKMGIEDITKNEAKEILQRFNIRVSSLPGHGNVGLKRKEILALAEQNSRTSIQLIN